MADYRVVVSRRAERDADDIHVIAVRGAGEELATLDDMDLPEER